MIDGASSGECISVDWQDVMQSARFLSIPMILAGLTICLFAAQAAAQERIRYEGEDGFKQSFSLSGGQYKLYVYARDPIPGYLPPGYEHCMFSGALERVSPTYENLPLGNANRISRNDWAPWRIERDVTLPAGRYTLTILSVTDCKWDFDLEFKANFEASEDSTVSLTNRCFLRSCVFPPIALSGGTPDNTAQSVSLRADMVEFVAPFIRWGNAAKPSGTCLIKIGDKTLKQEPLHVEEDPVSHHDHFYVIATWDKDATLSTEGKITVEFITSLGRSSTEFKITR